MAAAMTPIAARIDHYAYDVMLGWQPAGNSPPQSVVVAIDEQTLSAGHGMQNIRPILTNVLEQIAAAQPKAVALDVILHDQVDPGSDARLADALHATKNLILPCDTIISGNVREWEDPLPRFQADAAALGHVHLEEAGADGVTRQLPLEEIVDGKRRWALALEAFRVSQGERIIESPDDLQVGSVVIPSRRASGRPMLIRYLPSGIPSISALAIGQNRELLRGKTVFLGVTALSAARDRVVIPYGQEVSGLEIHAQAFETIARGRFLVPAADHTVWMLCALLAIAVGLDVLVAFRLAGLRARRAAADPGSGSPGRILSATESCSRFSRQ